MKKNGSPNTKFYESTEIIAQFDPVRTWLNKNFKKVSLHLCTICSKCKLRVRLKP